MVIVVVVNVNAIFRIWLMKILLMTRILPRAEIAEWTTGLGAACVVDAPLPILWVTIRLEMMRILSVTILAVLKSGTQRRRSLDRGFLLRWWMSVFFHIIVIEIVMYSAGTGTNSVISTTAGAQFIVTVHSTSAAIVDLKAKLFF